MLPDEQEVQDIKLQIGLMQKDIYQTSVLCERLSNLFQMIKLQEQKHEQHDKAETEIKGDIKDLHDRIDQVERHISQRIDDLRSDLIKHKKEEETHNIADVLKEIEKYKWIILGAVLILGWLIGNIDLGILFK